MALVKNGDNLFYPEALEEIKEFEQSIGDYPATGLLPQATGPQ